MRPFLTAMLSLIAGCFLLGVSCTSTNTPVAGGGSSETVIGMVVDSSGQPSVQAIVRLRRNDYLSRLPALAKSALYGADALTDDSGRFEISGIDPGSYRIEVSDGQTAVLFACSLAMFDTVDLGIDTLRPFATVTGMIDTAGRAGQQLYVQVVGLERLAAVDASRRFALSDLPAGTFSLRAVTANDTTVAVSSGISVGPGAQTTVTIQSGWGFFKRLYLNTTATGANVSGDVANFPLLVRFDATNFDFTQARDSGQDVRFGKTDGSPLPYEIEQWDPASRQAAIWVRMDTVRGNSSDQFIIMQYGNPLAASVSNGAAVFDTADGFAGVWHFAEAYWTSTIQNFADATSNKINGVAMGGVTSTNSAASPLGQALFFDGIDDYGALGDAGPLKIATKTISVWANPVELSDPQTHKMILSAGSGNAQYYVSFNADQMYMSSNDSNDEQRAADVSPVASVRIGQWHLYTWTIAIESDTVIMSGFVDGTEQSRIVRTGGDGSVYGSNFQIAGFDGSDLFKGYLDELRIVKGARSAAWIRLSFENQRAGQSLIALR